MGGVNTRDAYSVMELPVQSCILSPKEGETVERKRGGGRRAAAVVSNCRRKKKRKRQPLWSRDLRGAEGGEISREWT